MSSILITGAHGFVGGHLLSELGEGASPLEVDVTDANALVKAFRRSKPRAVVHLAAQASVASSWGNEANVWLVNAVGTVNLLAAATAEAPAARVLVVSTGDVYGRAEILPTPEDAAVVPLSPYAASKAAAEIAVEQMRRSHGLEVVIARAFSHIGPGQSTAFAIGSWTAQVADLEAVGGGTLGVGDLDVQRDLTDVRDVCRAYRMLLDPTVPASTYNVASGVAVRLADVVDSLVSLSRAPISISRDSAHDRPADIPVQQGDAARLHAATGWRPSIPLEQTLAEALDHSRGAARTRTTAG